MEKQLIVFTDGGARGNPGPAAIGFVVQDSSKKIFYQKGKFIGQATNNVAEYQAVIEALKWLVENKEVWKIEVRSGSAKYSPSLLIQFFLDSKLIVNQLNGFFKVKETKLRDLVIEVRQLEKKIGGNVSYHFIPRQKNKTADNLVNKILNQLPL